MSTVNQLKEIQERLRLIQADLEDIQEELESSLKRQRKLLHLFTFGGLLPLPGKKAQPIDSSLPERTERQES